MRLFLVLVASALPLAAEADVIRLANGQAISGRIQSCQEGAIVVAPPAAAPVLVKIADVASGEGADIERCLGGPVPTAQARGRRWYGGQVIIAETASLLLIPVGGAVHSGGLVGVGALGMLLSPAIVHGNHGNWGRALGSVGFHVGLGVAGAFLGAALGSGGVDEDEGLRSASGAAIGLLASQVLATTIDAASLAYEDLPPPRVALGVLFREPPGHPARPAPAGLAVTLRF